jgi:hypothetical protein
MTRSVVKKAFSYDIGTYVLIVIVSTIYWAKNFKIYSKYKGDDFFYFAVYLLVLTIAFYLIQLFYIRQLKYLIILLVPFLTILTSIILGFGILFISSMGGTPIQTIYIYGVVYALTNILFTIYLATQLTTKTKTPNG